MSECLISKQRECLGWCVCTTLYTTQCNLIALWECVCAFREFVKPYFQSAFTILQRVEWRGRKRWDKVTQRVAPTLRLMCVAVCDGLCEGEHAYYCVCLQGAEGETECRWGCQVKTERPGHCLLDTAASPPPPGRLPYCRTGSCSGRSSPPAYPHEERLHCPGTPESPVHTQTCSQIHTNTERERE